MQKGIKKGVYTLYELGAQALKKWPGRWKNQESAYASVKAAAQRLEIGDINGKKKYKLIAAIDAARILEELARTWKKKPQHGQADLFSLLPAEGPAVITANPDKLTKEEKQSFFDALKAGPVELLAVEPSKLSPEGLRQLETAAGLLQDALRVFCNCLIELERGRE